jgi:hypothetical protein
MKAFCTKCGGYDVKRDAEQEHPGVGNCAKCGPTYIDDVEDDPDGWVRELIAAGWKEIRLHVWQSPSGALYRGPFGAWRRMKALTRAIPA